MLIDYHIHNHFSPDSDEDTRNIAKRALDLGLKEICITNHSELHDPKTGKSVFDAGETRQRFTAVRDEINEIQAEFPGLKIRFGVEIEFAEERLDSLTSFVEEMDFDFILGSVHVVNNIVISSHKFADALFSVIDEETAYNTYFTNVLKLVEWGHLDAVAHFDICKKYGHKFYGPFDPRKYKKQILPILEVMAKKGIGLELNTNCIKEKCHEVFPHPLILDWAQEAGIRDYTFGSDAHKEKEVGQNLSEALKIAQAAGILTISTYSHRKPERHPF